MLRTAPVRLSTVLATACALALAGQADTASAAKARTATVKVPAPSAGKVAVATAKVTGKVTSVKATGAPKGATVTGAVRKGRMAVAVLVPKGTAVSKKQLTVTLKGAKGKPRVSGTRTAADLVFAPPAATGEACKAQEALAGALGARLVGPAPSGLGLALAGVLCTGKVDGPAATVLGKAGIELPAAGPVGNGSATGGPVPVSTTSGPPAVTPPPSNGGPAKPPTTTPTTPTQPTPPPPPADPECALNMGGDETFGIGLNGGCGKVVKVELDFGPAITECAASGEEQGWSCSVDGANAVATGPAVERVDVFGAFKRLLTCADKRKVTLHFAGGGTRVLNPAPWGIKGQLCAPGTGTGGDDPAGQEPDPDPECALNMGGDERYGIGLNGGCGDVVQIDLDFGPAITDCSASGEEQGWSCTVAGGNAVAKGPAVERVDVFGAFKRLLTCADKRKVTLHFAGGGTRVLDPAPWGIKGQPCAPGTGTGSDDPAGEEPQKAQCENGLDDDGDGQTDAVGVTTAANPDPGCSAAGDGSEGSESDVLPAGCTITYVYAGGDRRQPVLFADGCGSLTQAWMTAPTTPQLCAGFVTIGGQATQTGTCSVQGRTAMSVAAATTNERAVGVMLAEEYDGEDLGLTLVRADGTAFETSVTLP